MFPSFTVCLVDIFALRGIVIPQLICWLSKRFLLSYRCDTTLDAESNEQLSIINVYSINEFYFTFHSFKQCFHDIQICPSLSYNCVLGLMNAMQSLSHDSHSFQLRTNEKWGIKNEEFENINSDNLVIIWKIKFLQ